ncbi:MAG: 4Fe-4S dicluster domain-containing protein [Betaproteobacteria bacterium]|nr:MAG: 4Fe-4S dicluster domain-containing protein [Betaproteobacteria bacterium]
MSNDTILLSKADLAALVQQLCAKGTRVVGPVRNGAPGHELVDYGVVTDTAELVLGGPPPDRPLKPHLLPATEALFCWRREQKQVRLEQVGPASRPTVVIGARPCDAASLEIMDRVMGWDYRDEPWFERREGTTVVTLDCPEGDEACFCGSVGLSPRSTRGADARLMLTRGGYLLEVLSDKGRALCAELPAHSRNKVPSAEEGTPICTGAQTRTDIDPAHVRSWLESHFDDPCWAVLGVRCHGCGACAAVCPTCHCFDIVDEPEGIDSGTRRRNWDTCQTALFTLHGSGHNPRKDQAARLRQRVNHKFAIYPRRFDEILCTGCGRCIRVCPAGIDLIEILKDLGQRTTAEPRGYRRAQR